MKKALFMLGFLSAAMTFGQNNTNWFTASANPNSNPLYYIGLGTQTASPGSNLAKFNLHLHGTTDFTGLDKYSTSINYGKTFRLGFTNTTTGILSTDGTLIRQSGLDFTIDNQENKNINLTTGFINFQMNGALNRYFLGLSATSSTDNAVFNIQSTENGMYIRSTSATGYGLSLNVRSGVHALQVLDQDNAAKRNFSVTGTGEVFARKYTTTLANIPDYVFADDYKLMTFAQLKAFIETNKHLPNVPSASDYEANGVDLGELNRLLLEKVEELTLYILQMEERLKVVENTK